MIDHALPSYSRPRQLAATIEATQRSNRRVRNGSLVVLTAALIAVALTGGPVALWDATTALSFMITGALLAGVVIHFLQSDPVRQLTRLQDQHADESWLAQVQHVERTRRRYASRATLVVAGAVLALGIAADVVGTSLGTATSISLGKFAFLSSIFVASLLTLRHRQYVRLQAAE